MKVKHFLLFFLGFALIAFAQYACAQDIILYSGTNILAGDNYDAGG